MSKKKNLHKSKLKTHKFTETKVKKHQLKKKGQQNIRNQNLRLKFKEPNCN